MNFIHESLHFMAFKANKGNGEMKNKQGISKQRIQYLNYTLPCLNRKVGRSCITTLVEINLY